MKFESYPVRAPRAVAMLIQAFVTCFLVDAICYGLDEAELKITSNFKEIILMTHSDYLP